eukprot:1181939-Prorocentrum_minimum.AAC.1
MPLVFFTFIRVLRQAWRLDLTDKSPPDPLLTPSPRPLLAPSSPPPPGRRRTATRRGRTRRRMPSWTPSPGTWRACWRTTPPRKGRKRNTRPRSPRKRRRRTRRRSSRTSSACCRRMRMRRRSSRTSSWTPLTPLCPPLMDRISPPTGP